MNVVGGWRMQRDELVGTASTRYDEWAVANSDFLETEEADEAAVAALALAAKMELTKTKAAKALEKASKDEEKKAKMVVKALLDDAKMAEKMIKEKASTETKAAKMAAKMSITRRLLAMLLCA